MSEYRVWYRKPPEHGRMFEEDENMSQKTLLETHVVVTKDKFAGLEDAFFRMQAEVWSPNGEARGWIEHLGVGHTSMSVGDVLENCETGEYFQCASVGWSQVPVGE
jgi:hypothetical protein